MKIMIVHTDGDKQGHEQHKHNIAGDILSTTHRDDKSLQVIKDLSQDDIAESLS